MVRNPSTNATALETISDSGESHAYYSRVAVSLETQPPPLKEHLYQNFDQVFLAMEEQRQQQHHPDLIKNTEGQSTEQFYENAPSLSSPAANTSSTKEVVVNDEKWVL